MIKRITSLLRRIVGRINKDMVTSFFMTIGAIFIPTAFFLVVAAYEFNKLIVWILAFVLCGLGLFSLWYSLSRALREEKENWNEKRKFDQNSAVRHNEIKQLLQSINDKLSKLRR